MEKFVIAINIIFLLLLLLAIGVWVYGQVLNKKYNKAIEECGKSEVPLVKVDDSNAQKKVVKIYKKQVKLEDTLNK